MPHTIASLYNVIACLLSLVVRYWIALHRCVCVCVFVWIGRDVGLPLCVCVCFSLFFREIVCLFHLIHTKNATTCTNLASIKSRLPTDLCTVFFSFWFSADDGRFSLPFGCVFLFPFLFFVFRLFVSSSCNMYFISLRCVYRCVHGIVCFIFLFCSLNTVQLLVDTILVWNHSVLVCHFHSTAIKPDGSYKA